MCSGCVLLHERSRQGVVAVVARVGGLPHRPQSPPPLSHLATSASPPPHLRSHSPHHPTRQELRELLHLVLHRRAPVASGHRHWRQPPHVVTWGVLAALFPPAAALSLPLMVGGGVLLGAGGGFREIVFGVTSHYVPDVL